MKFTFAVKELPEKKLAGIYVKTDMNKAAQDCPALWPVFVERLAELSKQGVVAPFNGSYGVSIMQDESYFTYWAAIECQPGDVLSEKMETLVLSGGLYVHCTVPSLALLGDAFNEMYMVWPETQEQYQLDMTGPGFEFYDINWQVDGSLTIYAPVKKK